MNTCQQKRLLLLYFMLILSFDKISLKTFDVERTARNGEQISGKTEIHAPDFGSGSG